MHARMIAITGTHSTGKTSFLNAIEQQLASTGLQCGRIDDLARRARDIGFPILDQHTYESTMWIMAEALRQEAELMLSCDIILVDRPLIDAFGYLLAALDYSQRTLPDADISELEGMARAHCEKYELLLATRLDLSIPLGLGRDTNQEFRKLADNTIHRLLNDWKIDHGILTFSEREEMVRKVIHQLCD